MTNSCASQSLDQDFNFIPSQACSKTANHWIKRHFVRYDVKAYVPYKISGLTLTTMGLKELHICLLVIISLVSLLKRRMCGIPSLCFCVTHFFVNQHIQNPYFSNKFSPRNDDDDDNIYRSRSLCLKIVSRCFILYAATCILVTGRSLGFDFEY